MKSYENLLRPITVGNLELKNRMTFAPTYSFLADYDNHIGRRLIEWLRPIAAGGASLVVLGTCFPDKKMPDIACYVPWVGDDSCINGLSELFDTIHAYDCKAGVEFFLIGEEAEPFDVRDKLGKPQVEIDPTDLSRDKIQEYIECFALAAQRAAFAGVDQIVLHGAHAQLPGAFFNRFLNRRTDEYGPDTVENRARFTIEALEAMRARVGNRVAIEYRINGNDMGENPPTMEELLQFAKLIEDKIDSIHVSRGQLAVHRLTPYIFPPLYYERGYNIQYAEQFKKVLKIPVTCVGGMDIDVAEQAIGEGRIDMVAFSRPLLADPNLPNKVRHGKTEEIRPCVRCNTCIHVAHNLFLPVRCAINATLGRETLFNAYPKPKSSRKVAVIGGGPAGMEAAKTAADRGHIVTLYEASESLGGMLDRGSVPEFKKDMRKYLEWAVRTTRSKGNLTVRLATRAIPEMIKSEGFDVVIVAIGSEPVLPDLGDEYGKKAFWAGDLEAGRVEIGGTVIVAGAGMTGMEAAYSLAKGGRKVTLIDLLKRNEFGAGATKMNIIAIQEMLDSQGVRILEQTRLERITEKGIEVSTSAGDRYELPCDTLFVSFGVRPKKETARLFHDCAPDVIVVGDCASRQATLWNATRTAFDAAMSIL